MRFGKDVLKVVQYQQQPLIAERMGKAIQEWHCPPRQPDRLGAIAAVTSRAAKRRQRDIHDTISEEILTALAA
jgi:hypothetical protein